MDFPQFPPAQYITQGLTLSFATNPGELLENKLKCAPNVLTKSALKVEMLASIYCLANSGLNLKTTTKTFCLIPTIPAESSEGKSV